MQFVDGWELNGEYFPGVQDHELNLDKRIIEFCNDNKHWPLKQFNRVYRSSQNAALLQYRIPIRGQFVAIVRFIHNPNRKYFLSLYHLQTFNDSDFDAHMRFRIMHIMQF